MDTFSTQRRTDKKFFLQIMIPYLVKVMIIVVIISKFLQLIMKNVTIPYKPGILHTKKIYICLYLIICKVVVKGNGFNWSTTIHYNLNE